MRRIVGGAPGLVASLLALLPAPASAQCGGEERWAVKMGADPAAAQIDLQNPVVTALHDLVSLPTPSLPSDNFTRAAAERTLRVVEGFLVRFKKETGKTGDSDFHLVISDATLLFSPGGSGSQASPHSVIAEIPDPGCVAGREGSVTTPSQFAAQLASVRAKFEQQFPTITTGWNEAGGIPVRVTGVGFFDRPHNQVGRALNGLELHPLLDIEFNPTSPTPSLVSAVTTLVNPGFENGGTGWTATDRVITTNTNQAAHQGSSKAWLGGYGETHTDRLWQQVSLPASAHTISLTFFLHIDTEESTNQAFDKLRVLVRRTNGTILKELKTYSNRDAAPGYTLRSFDLTAFAGRTVRIELEAKEDNGTETSFVVDDFTLVVEP